MVTACLDLDSSPKTISFLINGENQTTAFEIPDVDPVDEEEEKRKKEEEEAKAKEEQEKKQEEEKKKDEEGSST